MVFSFLYFISAIALISGIYLFPKSNSKQNAVIWIPVCLLVYECFISFVGGIMSLIHIPTYIGSVWIVNFIFACFLYITIYRNKQIQKYEVKSLDIFLIFSILLIVILLGIYRFYVDEPLKYASSDPARHLSYANNIIREKTVFIDSGMYFGQFTNALFIQMLYPIFHGVEHFRSFEIKNLLNLWMAGAMLFSALRCYCKKTFSIIIAMLLTVVYMLGYPWNGQLWGFVYLGIGVNLIILVQFGMKMLYSMDIKKFVSLTIVALGCFGVGICYNLFAPPVFLAVLFSIIYFCLIKDDSIHLIITKTSIYKSFKFSIFTVFIPSIFSFVFFVVVDVSPSNTPPLSALATEGGIYRNLFTDFLPYLPAIIFFVLYFILKSNFKDTSFRDTSFMKCFTLVFVIYMFFFAYLMISGKMSSYYYYKLNYVFWFIAIFLTGIIIGKIYDKTVRQKYSIISYILCWIIVATFGLSGIDEKLAKKNILYNPFPYATSSFEIYVHNLAFFGFPPASLTDDAKYPKDFIDICKKVIELKIKPKRLKVIAETIRQYTWFYALLNIPVPPYSEKIPNLNPQDYVIVEKKRLKLLNKADKNYIDKLNKIYENNRGFIAKKDENE